MKGKRVYIVSVDDLWEFMEEKYGSGNYEETLTSVSDADYKSAVKAYGWELSLSQFVSEFNADGDYAPTNSYHYIRIY